MERTLIYEGSEAGMFDYMRFLHYAEDFSGASVKENKLEKDVGKIELHLGESASAKIFYKLEQNKVTVNGEGDEEIISGFKDYLLTNHKVLLMAQKSVSGRCSI
ncbi:MAG TPA: hypothetical protein ENG87_01675 [Candidatus Pacearchaeota archaeon]|nr:hypothetical protein BMS3Abin17_00024 [archaeon BMS3Abin17]HDK42061.1 hypothetical protein [Candidatus Pacearchaeota archaeon]HDZ61257.1 hypothetical protein [Candidatus Pacearchaeota archaeon]